MAKSKTKKTITAEEFDAKFEAGEDVSEYLDLDNAIKKVNVDFPIWMVQALDKEAARLQIPRQAVIKQWIAMVIDMRSEKAKERKKA